MLLAAWLVVLQAFLAGIATAQAATAALADPLAVICHNADGAPAADQPVSDAGKPWHLCCTACFASAHALPTPDAPAIVRAGGAIAPPGVLADSGVVLPRSVIRAGSSQGPPLAA
jgi:hypothetical protein